MPAPKQFDAVILGGGIAALGVGYALTRRGKKVLFIVPPRPLGGEATPASAGILDPFLESEHLAQPFFGFKKTAFLDLKKKIRALETESGMRTGFLECGMIFAAQTPAEERRLKKRLAQHRPSGIPLRWLDAPALRRRCPGLHPRLRGGLLYPTIARVLPARLQAALVRIVTRRGARWLRSAACARVILHEGAVAGLQVGRRRIAARCVINAGGSWAGRKADFPLRLPIIPIRGQVLLLSGKVRGLQAIVHSAGGIYVVPWEKKRYLLGSTVERAGFRARPQSGVLRRIRREAEKLAPGLGRLKPAASWAGLRPRSLDFLPVIGPTPVSGYYAAAGYYRSGIVIGLHAGELLVRGILAGRMPAALKPFSPLRFLRRKK